MSKPYVGGQAVIEGVMMRGPEYIATAVRTPSGDITVQKDRVRSANQNALIKGSVRHCTSRFFGNERIITPFRRMSSVIGKLDTFFR